MSISLSILFITIPEITTYLGSVLHYCHSFFLLHYGQSALLYIYITWLVRKMARTIGIDQYLWILNIMESRRLNLFPSL